MTETPPTSEAWDAHVRSHDRATYLQTSAWAKVKATTGWSSALVGADDPERTVIGAQVLLRPIPVLPWRFAYAPRGPLALEWTSAAHRVWTATVRAAARPGGPLGRAAMLRIDPEIEDDPTIETAMSQSGWRRAHDMQPRRTRIVDLTRDEEALWSDLRKKWRQYVNKARSNGIVVRDVDPRVETGAFDTFHEVMREVSKRTALPLRSAAAFRAVWEAFAPTGESRLLFADSASGETQAVLLLVRCGTRVVEPYGGMTEAGAESRANYLLKWEAIRTSKEQGATSYDMWGLIGTGIDYFKEGFGGREVRYIGAWDLALSPVGAALFHAAERGRQAYRSARRRLRGRISPCRPHRAPMPDITAQPRRLADLLDRWRDDGRLVDRHIPHRSGGPREETSAIKVSGISDDSRRVKPGNLFVAVRGLRVDGHDFLAEAVKRKASAVVVEQPVGELSIPQVVVDRGSAALASAAAWWYGDPSHELLTVGVTGTNGKTTTTFLAAAGLEGAGYATGLIGTVGIRIGEQLIRNEEPNTTPGSLDLQRILREMRDAAEGAAVIETSSHGLAADRVGSVDYDAAIFTNLSHEHLDFHGSFDAYRWAKASLFERLPAHGKSGRPGVGVINADDRQANVFIDATRGAGAHPVTYGTRMEADVRLTNLVAKAAGSRLSIEVGGEARKLNLLLPGRFNAHNALAVLALAHGLGLDLDAVSAALEAVRGVPGRMERIDRGQPFLVVVDYAHTPGALDAVLRELAPLAPKGRGVISVFGASGERDVGKRPLMGAAAAQWSRLVIVTEDDSRGEEPSSIYDAIARGAESTGKRWGDDLLVIGDRREAIAEAFRRARPGDVVLLAGKGHETWNMGPDGPEPWSDRDVAEEQLGVGNAGTPRA